MPYYAKIPRYAKSCQKIHKTCQVESNNKAPPHVSEWILHSVFHKVYPLNGNQLLNFLDPKLKDPIIHLNSYPFLSILIHYFLLLVLGPRQGGVGRWWPICQVGPRRCCIPTETFPKKRSKSGKALTQIQFDAACSSMFILYEKQAKAP